MLTNEASFEVNRHHGIQKIGYFSSYARDTWGVWNISVKLFSMRKDYGRFTEKDEHRTSNVQHRTLNGKKGTQRLLKLIQRVPLIKKPELLNDILQETEELIKIFVTSIKTAEKKQK